MVTNIVEIQIRPAFYATENEEKAPRYPVEVDTSLECKVSVIGAPTAVSLFSASTRFYYSVHRKYEARTFRLEIAQL